MKIGIQTWGSDGDIRPFLALAGGLSAAGHKVTFAYTSVDNKEYSSLAKAMNIKLIKVYKNLDQNYRKFGNDIIKTKFIFKQFLIIIEAFYEPFVENMYKASVKLCRENDLVIGHIINHTLLTAAEKYNCPRAVVILCPIVIDSKYIPPMGFPNFGKRINSLSWKFGDFLIRKKCYLSANQIRAREGIPPIKSIYPSFAKDWLCSRPRRKG